MPDVDKTISQIAADPNNANLVSGDFVLASRNGIDVKATVPTYPTLDISGHLSYNHVPNAAKPAWVISVPPVDNATSGLYGLNFNAEKMIVPFACDFESIYFQWSTTSTSYSSSTYVAFDCRAFPAGTTSFSTSNAREWFAKRCVPTSTIPVPTGTRPYFYYSGLNSDMNSLTNHYSTTTNRVNPENFNASAGDILQLTLSPTSPNNVYWHAVIVFRQT